MLYSSAFLFMIGHQGRTKSTYGSWLGSSGTLQPACPGRPSGRRAFVLPDSPGPMGYAPPDRGFSDSFCETSYETQRIFTGFEIIMRVGLVHPM